MSPLRRIGAPIEQTADALAATHTPLLTGNGFDPDQARHVARRLGGTLAFVTATTPTPDPP